MGITSGHPFCAYFLSLFGARPPPKKHNASAVSARARRKFGPWARATRTFLSKTEPPHATHLTQRIARRGERFGGLDLNFLVGNCREITFVFQARQPRAPCDACEQNAKDESAYMQPAQRTRCAQGVRMVLSQQYCGRQARLVLAACEPACPRPSATQMRWHCLQVMEHGASAHQH